MKFDINMPMDPSKAVIKVDGVELKRVSFLQINATPGEVPTIALQIIPDEINVTGEGWDLRTKEENNRKVYNEVNAVVNIDTESAKLALKEIEETMNRLIEKQKLIKAL